MLLASGELGYNAAMAEEIEKVGKNAQGEPKKKRPLYKRWWLWAVVTFIAAFVVCIGPWPACYEGYEGTDYANATFERLEKLDLTPTEGMLRAGAAKVEITPKIGEPLAGYSNRDPKACDGVIDKLYARAITLSNGDKTVTIVGGDILLVMPQLRDAILKRTGLPREDVYLTATHTHCGPGGYSSRWIDQISLGKYDEAVFNRLADAFAEAIKRSRENLEPGLLGVIHESVPGSFALNRIDKQAPAHTTITALVVAPVILDADRFSIASLVIASPHPTCYGKSMRKACGDYPTIVENNIESLINGTCMFASGAPGSMSPAKNGVRGAEQAVREAAAIVPLITVPAERNGKCILASAVLDVDLPPIQYRLGNYLRLSPIAGWYLHSRHSYIHILRINDLVLLGMPGDYSGELAMGLEKWAVERELGISPVITSFNGDYTGYLIPENRYNMDHYESREINFFGPYCGEYFNALSRKTVEYMCRSGQSDGSEK